MSKRPRTPTLSHTIRLNKRVRRTFKQPRPHRITSLIRRLIRLNHKQANRLRRRVSTPKHQVSTLSHQRHPRTHRSHHLHPQLSHRGTNHTSTQRTHNLTRTRNVTNSNTNNFRPFRPHLRNQSHRLRPPNRSNSQRPHVLQRLHSSNTIRFIRKQNPIVLPARPTSWHNPYTFPPFSALRQSHVNTGLH